MFRLIFYLVLSLFVRVTWRRIFWIVILAIGAIVFSIMSTKV
nr:MAG TPA: Cytochrome b558 alpha-subunit [Caudoviricetes sp.]